MNIVRQIFRSGITPKDAIRNLTKHQKNLISVCEEKNEENAEREEHHRNKVADDLAQIRFMLLGDPETLPKDEHCQKIVVALLKLDNDNDLKNTLFMKTLTYAKYYPPDAQKEAATIINYIIRKHDARFKEAFNGQYNVLVTQLLADYMNHERPRLQIQMSSIMREMMKDEDLHKYLLLDCAELRKLLLDNVKETNFDVASDAFNTLKSLLTKNKKTVAQFLANNYDEFFNEYNALIKSDNYVTKRQSLKLLGDVLLDKENKATMMRYISDKYNLQLLMMMLRDPSKAITFEAFHVFKVFVANPHQAPDVYRTLYKNKSKLIDFLENFQTEERSDDSQFTHEKQLLIGKLNKMTKTPEEYESYWETKNKGGKKKRAS